MASSARGLFEAALRLLRDPWKVLPGPSSSTEWKPAIYKAMEYRAKAPQYVSSSSSSCSAFKDVCDDDAKICVCADMESDGRCSS